LIENVYRFTGLGFIAAIPAPTALAVRTAEQAGITLTTVLRGDSFEIFTRPEESLRGIELMSLEHQDVTQST
jgi:FdhD protein